MDWVIKVVQPIYRVLRYADQQKPATVAGLVAKTYELQFELKEVLKEDDATYNRIMEIVNRRIVMLKQRTYIVPGKYILL